MTRGMTRPCKRPEKVVNCKRCKLSACRHHVPDAGYDRAVTSMKSMRDSKYWQFQFQFQFQVHIVRIPISSVVKLADSNLRHGMSGKTFGPGHLDSDSETKEIYWSESDRLCASMSHSINLNLNTVMPHWQYSLSAQAPHMDRHLSDSPEPLNHGNALLECLKAGRAGGKTHKYE